jgi:hypothetical protein
MQFSGKYLSYCWIALVQKVVSDNKPALAANVRLVVQKTFAILLLEQALA